MSDNISTLTILRCHKKGAKATKVFSKDENGIVKKKSFSAGMEFTHEQVPVSNLEELGELIDSLSDNPKKFIITGQIKKNMDEVVYRRRNGSEAAFEAIPRLYVMLDIDKLKCPDFIDPAKHPKEAATWAREALPKPFRETTCYYRFSSSQNVLSGTDESEKTISIHLWFWLDRPVLGEEWKRYFKSVEAPVDHALFSPVQIHYTAKPIFENIEDPLPIRSGFLEGQYKVLSVPLIPEPEKSKAPKHREAIKPDVSTEDRKKALEILRPYYKEGARNRLSGAIAATLYRAGWASESAANFVYELADCCSDHEAEERSKSAINICDAVDSNLPAQGIPTLKKEFSIKEIDRLLSLLGCVQRDIKKEISRLSNKSNKEEVRRVIAMLLPLKDSEQKLYIEELQRVTKLSKGVLKAMLDEEHHKQKGFRTADIADELVRSYLNGRYKNGLHFLRSSDKRFWKYNSSYWEVAPDDLVKKEIIEDARELLAYLEENRALSPLVNSAINLLEGEAFKNGDPFGLKAIDIPSVINCRNGELWFDENGSVTLKPHRADSYLRYYLDVEYNPQARSPIFDKAVLEIFSNSSEPEDMFRHFMELAGYICQPWRKLAIIVLLYGHGSNGKSSLIRVISRVLSDKMVSSGRISDIGNDKFRTGNLDGKLMLFEDDLKANTNIDDGILKMISEEKLLTVEQKYKDPYEFYCRAVPIMGANHFPTLNDLSKGFRRRMLVIPFKRQFSKQEKDTELFERIWREEASGILNQFIWGFERLRRRGDFQEPKDCLKAKDRWLSRSNVFPAFIEDRCETGKHCKQSLKDLYEEYEQYCRDTGVSNTQRQQWVRARLEDLEYEISVKDGQPFVRGVRAIKPEFRGSEIKL